MWILDLLTLGRTSRARKRAEAAAAEGELQRLHDTGGVIVQTCLAGSLAAFAVVTAASHDLGHYGAVLAGLGAAFGVPTLYGLLSLSQSGSDPQTLANKRELVRLALLSVFFLVEVALAATLVTWLVHHH